jgi:glycosyltransferase involved in cell wall biosynthesis
MIPIRVLHVIGGVSWKYGGTTASVLPLCDALARLPGLTVDLAATDADGPGGRLTPDTAPKTLATLRLFRRTWSERWKFSAGLGRWLVRHAGDYDVVHVHGLWGFASVAAGQAAARRRVPLVVFPQGMLSPYTWSRGRGLKRAYWRLVERRVVRGAARLHLTSRGEAAEVGRLGLGVPAAVIPLGLEPAAFDRPADPGWLRGRLGGRDRGRPLVLFLSRLHPKKGVAEVLLPAVTRLRADAYVVIAGGPDATAPEYDARIAAEVARLGLADRVHLLGPVAPDDRWPAFDGADVFVLPSHQENFGLVVTEAMARGCPAVVSEHAFACEHLAAADAGRVVPLDPAAVASALDALLADPAGRAELGRRGREYARQHLGWDGVAAEVAGMYRDVLAGRAVPRTRSA